MTTAICILIGALFAYCIWSWAQMPRREALILELLERGGELYGLDLVERSDGALSRGTIYVHLNSMEERGLITSRLEDPPPGITIPRRLYRIVYA